MAPSAAILSKIRLPQWSSMASVGWNKHWFQKLFCFFSTLFMIWIIILLLFSIRNAFQISCSKQLFHSGIPRQCGDFTCHNGYDLPGWGHFHHISHIFSSAVPYQVHHCYGRSHGNITVQLWYCGYVKDKSCRYHNPKMTALNICMGIFIIVYFFGILLKNTQYVCWTNGKNNTCR